ncbi:MAG: thiamine diphosphokinase [Clostridia bacterium]|nr:thiamine diphosphokinase [Clostridia bacterium]
MEERNMGRCVIIGSRDNGRMEFLDTDFVMACDGGFANMGGRRPNMVVGDFDSLGYVPEGFEVLYHPPEKDDTDVMLAVREGFKRGYSDFVLYGCMGGRIDHAYANYQVLAFITSHGGRAVMKGDGWSVTHIEDSSISIPGGKGKVFSVFAHGGEAVVTIKNAKYELEHHRVTPDFPLGVSNEREDKAALIEVSGRVLVMWED